MPEVILTEEFATQVKRLSKKFPNVKRDLQPLMNQLSLGETPGDRLQGQPAVAYKVRLANRDAQRGKRGGYRVIYYVKTTESILLLTMYSKSDQDDVSDVLISSLIEKYSPKLHGEE